MKRFLLPFALLIAFLWTSAKLHAQEMKLSPHGDIQQACDQCHSADSWKVDPFAVPFDHSTTDFPLEGQHRSVSCRDCHKDLTFANTPQNCFQCHTDTHSGALGNRCEECHATTNWIDLGKSIRQHDLTRFPLQGVHRNIDCLSCHSGGRYAGTPLECVICHSEQYEATENPPHKATGIPADCALCHSSMQPAWKGASFAHSASFPLLGGHSGLDCASCHAGTFEAVSTECISCHRNDYNSATDPNHLVSRFPTDCRTCHTIGGWEPAQFDHSLARFQLTGRHRRADCAECHTNGRFTGTPQDCYACHSEDYRRADDPDHQAGNFSQRCDECHNTDDWDTEEIDHGRTDFPLEGAHRSVNCADCHTSGFTGTSKECLECHRTDFQSVRDPNHVAGSYSPNCTSCHSLEGWKPATFDHNLTAFPLTGSHFTVDCASCHLEGRYNGTSSDCFGCHQADYQTSINPGHSKLKIDHDCRSCHSTQSWRPSNFQHSNTAFALTGAHKLADCGECHIGGKFAGTPDECLECHRSDYQSTEQPNHPASRFDPNCTSCHTTSAWKPSTFKHELTEFPLTGAHRMADCESCHGTGQFDGIASACFSCHQTDFENTADPNHVAGNYSQSCQVCHSTLAWSPANLDHNLTSFPLTGAHQTVECADCHQNNRYDGTPSECYPCHTSDFESVSDPNHVASQFDHTCTPCHTTTAWTPAQFDHSLASFQLEGAHRLVDCLQCHSNERYTGTPEDCWSCHSEDFENVADPNHRQAQFDPNCTICHSLDAWTPATFDHSVSDFPLEGAHREVNCADCHQSGQYNGLPNACIECHRDNFESVADPNHVTGQFDPNCTICHSVDAWTPATFDHSVSDFPLEGAHREINCADCHQNGQYNGLSNACIECHRDNFESVADPNHVTGQFDPNCTVCHSVEAWTPATFDHAISDFPLEGAHQAVNCADCHQNGQFNDLPFACIECHRDNYENVADPNHVIGQFDPNCTLCHSLEGWTPATFDHDETDFPLTGAHIAVNCAQCHLNGRYNGLPDACINCHQNDFNAARNPNHPGQGLPQECTICHTTANWDSNFQQDHDRRFPIYTGRHREEWNRCNECHLVANNFQSFSCIDCHEHSNRNEVDRDHREVNQYQYVSSECYRCHPNGREDDFNPPGRGLLPLEKGAK